MSGSKHPKKSSFNFENSSAALQDDSSSAAMFQDVTKAYEVLRDPQKRNRYNQMGAEEDGQGYEDRGGAYRRSTTRAEDIFSSIFGGGAVYGFGTSGSMYTSFQVSTRQCFVISRIIG